MYPQVSIRDEEEKELVERELTEESGIEYLIRGLHGTGGMDTVFLELYSWYKRDEKWKEKVESLLKAGYYRRPMDGLTQEAARRLYGEDFEDSITRMERFSVCAFAHFLACGLNLKERQQYEFQALDLGNICHSALERYSKKIAAKGCGWTEISEEEGRRYIEESVEEAVTDYGSPVLYSSARDEYMIVRMKRMLGRTVWALTMQLKAGDFRPSAFELRFANGKIDRIDTCREEEKVYVKIVDYKTGRKAFDIVSLYHGLELQLMVYMDAAIRLEKAENPGKEIVPAGVFYYRIQDPLVDKSKTGGEEELLLKELKPDGIINLKDEVLEHLDHTKSGESLAVPVRYNKNGSLAKGSKAVTEEEFQLMMRHAARKVEEAHLKILEGRTEAVPYRKGQETGCDYCRYRHVCGFDVKIPGYGYREIGKMSREEALAAMAARDGGKEGA